MNRILPEHLRHTASEMSNTSGNRYSERVRHDDRGIVRILDIPNKSKHGEEGREWDQPDDRNWWKDSEQLEEKVLGNDIDQIRCRVVLVEDLCPDLIDSLGAVFAINPEFFEEHLNASRYNQRHHAPATGPSFMPATDGFRNISIRWWRPLYRKPFRKNRPIDSLITWKKFMKSASLYKEYTPRTTLVDRPSATVRRGNITHEHTLKPNTNIFRQEWDVTLAHTVDNRNDEDRATVGWEERLTIHCQVVGECRLCKGFLHNCLRSIKGFLADFYSSHPLGSAREDQSPTRNDRSGCDRKETA